MEYQIDLSTDRINLMGITPNVICTLFQEKTEEEIINYLGISQQDYFRYERMNSLGMETERMSLFFFLLIDKKTELPIGECGFHTWNTYHCWAELFYKIHHEGNRQLGILSEVLPKVLEYGFEKLSLNRIEAYVDPNNEPSVKLLSKNNFTFEGTAREHYLENGVFTDSDIYSILKREFIKK